jgi:hypothetical protein
MDIYNISKLNKSSICQKCSNCWNESNINKWTVFDTMNLDQVKGWQDCASKRFGLEDRTAFRWMKEFVYAYFLYWFSTKCCV